MCLNNALSFAIKFAGVLLPLHSSPWCAAAAAFFTLVYCGRCIRHPGVLLPLLPLHSSPWCAAAAEIHLSAYS
jgi:hypothetical protein